MPYAMNFAELKVIRKTLAENPNVFQPYTIATMCGKPKNEKVTLICLN